MNPLVRSRHHLEARQVASVIVLVASNVALALSGPGAAVVPVATGAAAALAVGMFVMVAVRIGRNLSALGRLEPPPTASPPRHLTATSPEGYLLKNEAVRPIWARSSFLSCGGIR